jgi:ComF family protein
MQGGWLRGLAAAAPSRCAVCEAWPADPVCADCRGRFGRPAARCRRCALPVPPGQSECGACASTPPPLERCAAAVSYAFPWAGLVGRFKFQGEPGWADTFAAILAETPGVREILAEAELVIPMPLAPARLAERGFNQALEISRRLAPRSTQPGLLLRLRDTAPQSALGLAERQANVQGAFAPDPLHAHRLRGRQVVLVDDVMTSGASLFAAADALRAAGVRTVSAIAFARTDTPQP